MSTDASIAKQLERFQKDFEDLRRELGKVIVGQQQAVNDVLTAVVAGGHVLLEGLPGVGKTVLAESLSRVIQLSFQRIQFTPDLMPSDLLGTYVIMETPEGRRTFEFQKGPIFANLVLADQINRGTPKTQSALLEAMEGQQITVANETFQLPRPMVVVATQNPLEMEGTFPLPEPQVDRFFAKAVFDAPSPEEIEEILRRTTEGEPPVAARVVDGARLLQMREIAQRLALDDTIRRQVVRVVAATHPQSAEAPGTVDSYVQYGASPRGAQALVLSAKVRAMAQGRSEVTKDDLCSVAPAVLRHRLVLNFAGQANNISPETIIDDILRVILGPEAGASAQAEF